MLKMVARVARRSRPRREPGAARKWGEERMASRNTQRQLAPALSRGIRILELLAQSPRGWSLTDIADELAIAKSSAFGLCATLLSAGLIERASDGAFRLGLRVVEYAKARVGNSSLPSEFYSTWDSLGVFRQEAAILSVRDGVDVVYIACRNSSLPLGVTFQIGMRLPASCTATGKALLATLSDGEIRTLYQNHKLARLTRSSVASIDALLRQLAEVRKRGYSIDDGETRDHMCSFGAAVFDGNSHSAAAGIAISFLKTDLTQPDRAKAARVVREFADTLSRNIGAGGTPQSTATRSR